MALPPNPQRKIVQGFGLLPKVFIAYPHNPDVYVQIDPTLDQETILRNPGVSQEELYTRLHWQIQAHENAQQQKIQAHEKLIQDFANFLQSSGVAVAYDQLLTDVGSDNIMKWCQEQIDDSDYVILVVTNSFKDFLENDVPPESEHIFIKHFLYNFVHNPGDKQLLPVFLNQAKDVQMLPVTLQMNKLYEIWTPFDVRNPKDDDLQALYALLTKQNTVAAPPPTAAPISLPKKRRIGGGSRGQQPSSATATHHQMYRALCSRQEQALTDHIIAKVSERADFSVHWKQLARHLGLSDAQVERCETHGRGDQREMCLAMLMHWRTSGTHLATLSGLADVIFNKYRNVSMFEILYSVVTQ